MTEKAMEHRRLRAKIGRQLRTFRLR